MRRVLLSVFLALVAATLLGGCKRQPPVVRADLPPPPARADRVDPAVSAPTVEISSSPSSIERGQQTSLSWSSRNAASLIIDGGIGNVGESGQLVVSPRDSTTYTITATNAAGDARASTRVTVVAPDFGVPADMTDIEIVEGWIREGLIQPVFFEYDRAELSAQARAILETNARYFRQKPSVRIIIEGHCDERGTEEYNLALGERRSQAARDYLVQVGVDGGQLETISYGEERPFALGSNEEAWALNRRAHFTVRR